MLSKFQVYISSSGSIREILPYYYPDGHRFSVKDRHDNSVMMSADVALLGLESIAKSTGTPLLQYVKSLIKIIHPEEENDQELAKWKTR